MPNETILAARLGTIYDPARKQFKREGNHVSRAAVRAEIDKLSEHIRREAGRIGGFYAKGQISLVEFEIGMRDLLKSGHIAASSVGRGGRLRMTQSDWGKVGARLKKEYGYLAKFVRKLERGSLLKIVTPNRAKKYSASVRMSYWETAHKEATLNSVSDIKVRLVQNSKEGCSECTADAARGWVAVEDLDLLGTRICGNFCRCEIFFDDM